MLTTADLNRILVKS